jgi:hypothetical protein
MHVLSEVMRQPPAITIVFGQRLVGNHVQMDEQGGCQGSDQCSGGTQPGLVHVG